MFDDMIPDIEANKKLNPIVFISKSCFKVPKSVRLKAADYFIMKIPNRKKLEKITSYSYFRF